LVSQQNVTRSFKRSLVDENGTGHGGYPGGPVNLDIVRIIVVRRQHIVALLGVGEVKCSIVSVIGCVVSQDYVLLGKGRTQETTINRSFIGKFGFSSAAKYFMLVASR